MALLSTFYHPLYTHHNHRTTTRQSLTRHGTTVMSCRKQKLPEESQGMIRRTVAKIVSEVEKIGKKMKPEKKKGDIKDLMLMSFSFAVYVYISQLIVCAYFAWRHVNLPNPHGS